MKVEHQSKEEEEVWNELLRRRQRWEVERRRRKNRESVGEVHSHASADWIERIQQGIGRGKKSKIVRHFSVRVGTQIGGIGLTCRKRRRYRHEPKIGRPRGVQERRRGSHLRKGRR